MRCWRSKAFLATLPLLLVRPAHAAWGRIEFVDAAAGRGFSQVRLFDTALHNERYGFGLGFTTLDARLHGWDIRRRGQPDASAHVLLGLAPVTAHWTIWNWEGPANFRGLDFAQPPVGHLSAYFHYGWWARLAGFTEVERPLLGEESRVDVEGRVPATYSDYGLRLDYGNYAAVSIGRMEFKTKDHGIFRARTVTQPYVLVHLYFAIHKHPQRQGGAVMFLRDGWDGLRSLFRCRGWRCNIQE